MFFRLKSQHKSRTFSGTFKSNTFLNPQIIFFFWSRNHIKVGSRKSQQAAFISVQYQYELILAACDVKWLLNWSVSLPPVPLKWHWCLPSHYSVVKGWGMTRYNNKMKGNHIYKRQGCLLTQVSTLAQNVREGQLIKSWGLHYPEIPGAVLFLLLWLQTVLRGWSQKLWSCCSHHTNGWADVGLAREPDISLRSWWRPKQSKTLWTFTRWHRAER